MSIARDLAKVSEGGRDERKSVRARLRMRRANQVLERYLRLGGSLALLEAWSDRAEELAIVARSGHGARGSEVLVFEYPFSHGAPLVPRLVSRLLLTDEF